MLVDWLGESSDSGDEHGKLSGHGRRLERNSERERGNGTEEQTSEQGRSRAARGLALLAGEGQCRGPSVARRWCGASTQCSVATVRKMKADLQKGPWQCLFHHRLVLLFIFINRLKSSSISKI